MLKSITDPTRDVPLVEMRYTKVSQVFEPIGLLCTWGDELKLNQARKAQYLSNLDRLGIIEITFEKWISEDAEAETTYQLLKERMEALAPKRADWMLVNAKGMAVFTPLGRQFWRTCVRRPE